MRARTESARSVRLVASVLALAWLGAGCVAIVLAVSRSRWLPGVIGFAALYYGLLWVRVVRLGRRLKLKEAMMLWRPGSSSDA